MIIKILLKNQSKGAVFMSVCTWHVPRLAFIGLHSRYDVCTVERQLLIHTYMLAAMFFDSQAYICK